MSRGWAALAVVLVLVIVWVATGSALDGDAEGRESPRSAPPPVPYVAKPAPSPPAPIRNQPAPDGLRDRCLKAIAREFTAYMADHDCRSILGAEYCQALLIGMDVRSGRGQSSEKIERVYYAHCS